LAPTFVPLTNERAEPLKDAISNHRTDVICLEKVWLPEHVEAIQKAAENRFPYAYSIPPEQKFTDQAACTETEIDPLVSCIEDHCPNMTVVDAICVLANCSIENEATGVIGDFEESCEQFLDAGYRSPGMDVLGCSYCDNNLPNISKGEKEGNLQLDHIFIRNPLKFRPFYVGTVFNDVIEVETSQGLQDANLSDHFGVRVEIPL